MASDTASLVGPDLRATGHPSADLADGAMLLGHADGEAVLIARSGGEFFAVGATCSHYSGPLAEGLLVGDTVRCPWHHACFSLRTGEALRAPALNPIACWDIEQRDQRLFVTRKHADRDPLAPATPSAKPIRGPASVVIIGAGAAGSAAAEMLRRQGYAGPVTVVDQEPDSPYDRPNLSKDFLAGTAQEDWIPLRPPGFYEQHQIDIIRTSAESIDLKSNTVRLAGGRTLYYGALLVATGAEPNRLNVPGSDRPMVHVLRSLADSKVIIEAATHARHAVVIGGSFIGLEVAASLRQRNLDVHVVAMESTPLERVLGPEVGRVIQKLHEDRGVVFHLSALVDRVEEHAVRLKDGTTLSADLVVLGVGVSPRLNLASDAGLRVERGIVVDQYLQTSAPNVYAAGDVARWPDPHSSAEMRVEHWVVAQRQGQTAARNMLGASEAFDAVPFFWSQHYDAAVRYSGHAENWDQTLVAGALDAANFSLTYRRGGKTLAVASLGQDRANLEAEARMERA
jgi:NADPH-dependent 2,4-dienoyl-CoA reductase/sulfur reductase-like enzyme/nitrite reductase/ring-hydroxylating ferredoxin subunit